MPGSQALSLACVFCDHCSFSVIESMLSDLVRTVDFLEKFQGKNYPCVCFQISGDTHAL